MASTKLKRKAQRNKSVAKVRVDTIKRLGTKPVIKQVDVQAIKDEFAKGGKKAAPKAKAEVVEEKAAEVAVEEVAEKKAEKKPAAKKPAAKKPAAKKTEAKAEKAKADDKKADDSAEERK